MPGQQKKRSNAFPMILGMASLGGLAGAWAAFPGSVMICAMLAVAIWNLLTGNVNKLPRWMNFLLQVLTGTLVGVQLTPEKLAGLCDNIVPLFIIVGLLFLFSLLCMMLLYRKFHWDLSTAWLASAPGRMQDILIMGASMNADLEKIMLTHILRIFSVASLTPIFFSLIK